jgi:hypothetical protein
MWYNVGTYPIQSAKDFIMRFAPKWAVLPAKPSLVELGKSGPPF